MKYTQDMIDSTILAYHESLRQGRALGLPPLKGQSAGAAMMVELLSPLIAAWNTAHDRHDESEMIIGLGVAVIPNIIGLLILASTPPKAQVELAEMICNLITEATVGATRRSSKKLMEMHPERSPADAASDLEGNYCDDPGCVACTLRKGMVEILRKEAANGASA